MNNLESGKKLFRNKSRIASNSPGVYQILDDKNKVIYVGKAKNLPKRLQNYSTKSLLQFLIPLYKIYRIKQRINWHF